MSDIVASHVQIAVALADCDDAQAALDTAAPGVFDVTTMDRTVWAEAADPMVPAFAVAQGRVEQAEYAVLAMLAAGAGINHLSIGAWLEGSPEVYVAADSEGTLWAAMDLVPVEEPL